MAFLTYYDPFWEIGDQIELWLLTMRQSCSSFANMARQAGDIRITGTIDDFCFYKMDNVYYVRMKSRLTGKRFWRDKAFEGSRMSCNRFAEGNRIASKVYRMVEGKDRVYKLFCFLKNRAICLLKEAKSVEEVEKTLVEYLVGFGLVREKVNGIKQRYLVSSGCTLAVSGPDSHLRKLQKQGNEGWVRSLKTGLSTVLIQQKQGAIFYRAP